MIKWFEKNYLIPILITALIAGFIFYLSAIPSSGYPSGIGILTKIYHFGIFLILAFFLSISIVRGKENQLIYLSTILSILYALTDELHQLFVPGRTSTVTDVLIDSIGVLTGNIIYLIILKIRKPKQHPKPF